MKLYLISASLGSYNIVAYGMPEVVAVVIVVEVVNPRVRFINQILDQRPSIHHI